MDGMKGGGLLEEGLDLVPLVAISVGGSGTLSHWWLSQSVAVAHYLTGGYLSLPSQAHPPLVAAVSNAMDQFYSCALTVVRTHSVQCACGESTDGRQEWL